MRQRTHSVTPASSSTCPLGSERERVASVATQARGSRGALALWGGNLYESGLRLTLPIGDMAVRAAPGLPAPGCGSPARTQNVLKNHKTRVQASFTVQVTALCLQVTHRTSSSCASRASMGAHEAAAHWASEQTITPPARGTSASRLERSRSGAVRTRAP
jgi:hypothetical protein